MRDREDTTPNPLTSLSAHQFHRQSQAQPAKRKPSAEQSRALEMLAHASEYLIDEGLLCGDTIDLNVTEAVQLLSYASRSAYLACTEVPCAGVTRRGGAPLVRWQWIPAAPFLVPVFRDHASPGQLA